ncbi:MAG: hypothetical protein JWO51_1481 [Rhodospirillales bacterium]|nr:hypothetical protein [Rhodospirillales bacterium]
MSVPHILSIAALGGLFILGACQERVGEREESLGPHVHRLTVDIHGDQPSEARLGNAADAICPAGYVRQSDETMPPQAPAYRVWLVRCK